MERAMLTGEPSGEDLQSAEQAAREAEMFRRKREVAAVTAGSVMTKSEFNRVTAVPRHVTSDMDLEASLNGMGSN